MKAQVDSTVDINYHKYNTEYVDKALERVESFKKDKDVNANKEIEGTVREEAKYIHRHASGKKTYVFF